MKRIAIYIIFTGLFISCTQNNGDIGYLFGKWQLREIQTANESVAYDSVFYNFQGGVVELQRILPYYAADRAWGYFKHNQNELTLTIRNRALHEMAKYQLPDTLVTFKVQELTNKGMTLQLGEETIYRFRKFGN